jgi:hypothetical protein
LQASWALASPFADIIERIAAPATGPPIRAHHLQFGVPADADYVADQRCGCTTCASIIAGQLQESAGGLFPCPIITAPAGVLAPGIVARITFAGGFDLAGAKDAMRDDIPT